MIESVDGLGIGRKRTLQVFFGCLEIFAWFVLSYKQSLHVGKRSLK